MAGRNIVDEIFIAIGMDTSDVDKNINALVDNVSGKLKSIAMGVVAPALAAITSGQIVQQFTQEIIQVDRLSESLGINIEKLQQWQGAAEMAGVAGEEVGELFADINDWMTDLAYNDSGPLKDAVEKGLLTPVKNVNGELKNSEQYLMEMADSFRNMSKQEATGIGRQIGIGRADVVAWLQQGSAGINAQLEHVKRLGVYTKEDAKAAKDFTNASNDLARAMKMMLLPVYRVLAPAATKIAEGLSFLAQHAEALIPVLIGVSGVMLKSVWPALTKLALAAKSFILSPWGIAIAALLLLGYILEDFIGWLNGEKNTFGDYYQAIADFFKNGVKALEDFQKNARAAIIGFRDDVVNGFNDFVSSAQAAFDKVKPYIDDWVAVITSAVELVLAIWKWLIGGGDKAADEISKTFEKLKNNLGKHFDNMWGIVKKFWSVVEPIFSKIAGFFGDGNKKVHLSIDDRRAGGIDNSNRQTDVKLTNNFYGVKDAEDARDKFARDALSSPLVNGPANGSY